MEINYKSVSAELATVYCWYAIEMYGDAVRGVP